MKDFIFNKVIIFILSLSILTILSCKGEVASKAEAKINQKSSETVSVGKDRIITVYYFHTTYRCYSCTKIEELTKQALTNNFKNLLKSGKMIFKTANIEENQNKHFIHDYKFFTKSVVLVDLIKGKQKKRKRLDKTWSYLRDSTLFEKYIKDETIAFTKR